MNYSYNVLLSSEHLTSAIQFLQLEYLSKLKHPNIIKLYGSCTNDLHWYIIEGKLISQSMAVQLYGM